MALYSNRGSGGGMAVGSAVSGGTSEYVLVVDGSGNLSTPSPAGPNYDPGSGNFAVGEAAGTTSGYLSQVRSTVAGGGILRHQVRNASNGGAAGVLLENSSGDTSEPRMYGSAVPGTFSGITLARSALWLTTGATSLAIGGADGIPVEVLTNAVDAARVGGTLATAMTAVGNVGAGDDTLQSFTCPASLLARTGDSVWAEFKIKFAANANSKRVRVKFGATTVYDSGAQAQNGGHMFIFCRVNRTGAATQIASGCVLNTAGTPLFNDDSIDASPTETLSGTVAFSVTGEAVANDDITATARWGWEPGY